MDNECKELVKEIIDLYNKNKLNDVKKEIRAKISKKRDCLDQEEFKSNISKEKQEQIKKWLYADSPSISDSEYNQQEQNAKKLYSGLQHNIDNKEVLKGITNSICELPAEEIKKLLKYVTEGLRYRDKYNFEVKDKDKFIDPLDKEKQKKFYEAITELDDKEKQKKFYEAITELDDKEKQKKFYEAITELDDKIVLKSDILFFNKTYKFFIKKDKIDSDFYKDTFEKFIGYIFKKNENEKSSEMLQALRESCYRLILKQERESLRRSELKKFFLDFEQKYRIKNSKRYKKYERKQKKRIIIFKEKVFSKKVYKRLLHSIAKNRIYSSTFDMFELVLYIADALKSFSLIKENYPRFSYMYFLQNDNSDSTMLNELFTPYGFCFKKNKDRYSHFISFEELLEVSYISEKNRQISILDRYASHCNKIYLLLALSNNPALDIEVAERIKRELESLSYTYPFSEDIHNIYSQIESNIYKLLESNESNKNIIVTEKKDTSYHIYNFGNNYIKLEEFAKQIMYRKSDSLMNYFKSINEFLECYLQELEEHNNSMLYFKTTYTLYLFKIIENDYRLIYYEEFYLEAFIDRIKQNDFFMSQDYEILLFAEYLKIIIKIASISKKLGGEKQKMFIIEKFKYGLDKILQKKLYSVGIYLDIKSLFEDLTKKNKKQKTEDSEKEVNFYKKGKNFEFEIKDFTDKNAEEILSGVLCTLNKKNKENKEKVEEILELWYGDKSFLGEVRGKENIQKLIKEIEKIYRGFNKEGLDEKEKIIYNHLFEDYEINKGKIIEKAKEDISFAYAIFDRVEDINKLFKPEYGLLFLLDANYFEKLSENNKHKIATEDDAESKKIIKDKFPSLKDFYALNYKTIEIFSKAIVNKSGEDKVLLENIAKSWEYVGIKKDKEKDKNINKILTIFKLLPTKKEGEESTNIENIKNIINIEEPYDEIKLTNEAELFFKVLKKIAPENIFTLENNNKDNINDDKIEIEIIITLLKEFEDKNLIKSIDKLNFNYKLIQGKIEGFEEEKVEFIKKYLAKIDKENDAIEKKKIDYDEAKEIFKEKYSEKIFYRSIKDIEDNGSEKSEKSEKFSEEILALFEKDIKAFEEKEAKKGTLQTLQYIAKGLVIKGQKSNSNQNSIESNNKKFITLEIIEKALTFLYIKKKVPKDNDGIKLLEILSPENKNSEVNKDIVDDLIATAFRYKKKISYDESVKIIMNDESVKKLGNIFTYDENEAKDLEEDKSYYEKMYDFMIKLLKRKQYGDAEKFAKKLHHEHNDFDHKTYKNLCANLKKFSIPDEEIKKYDTIKEAIDFCDKKEISKYKKGDLKTLLILAKCKAIEQKKEKIEKVDLEKASQYLCLAEEGKKFFEDNKLNEVTKKKKYDKKMFLKSIKHKKINFEEEVKKIIDDTNEDDREASYFKIFETNCEQSNPSSKNEETPNTKNDKHPAQDSSKTPTEEDSSKDYTSKDIILFAKYLANEKKSEKIEKVHLESALSSFNITDKELCDMFSSSGDKTETIKDNISEKINKVKKEEKMQYADDLKNDKTFIWLERNMDKIVAKAQHQQKS